MCGGGLRAREPASSSPAGCSWDWPGRASEGRQRPRHELPGMPSTTTLRGGRDRLSARGRKRAWGTQNILGCGKPWDQVRRPDTKAAATTRSAPGQGPLGAGRDSRGSSPRGPQRNKPRGACSSVASPSRSVAFTGRRAGESRAPSPGARRNQPQRTQKPAAAEPKETGSKGRGRNRRADRKCVVGTGNVL